jgi:ADP-ribosylglycohydrolase
MSLAGTSSLSSDPAERLQRARVSLEGLSVGDGFGEQFFSVSDALNFVRYRELPMRWWLFTDDTNMALSIYAVLRQYGRIEQEALALSYAEHYALDRGYGPAMHLLLGRIGEGVAWRKAAGELFEGQGSYGNGAAMRVAPLGAYFADDMDKVVEQARFSAEVTHAHEEGIAGAIAVAVAAAYAANMAGRPSPKRDYFLMLVHRYVPDSIVREKIRHAYQLAPSASLQLAMSALGNGSLVSAQDTVAFCLWCAAGHLDNYEEALWLTAGGMGDVDTNCAIVGGIVAAKTGVKSIPAEWVKRREPLPDWAINA